MIDEEAIKGVEHAKTAIKLRLEVTSLEETHDRLIARLDFSKTKLGEFKSNFLA